MCNILEYPSFEAVEKVLNIKKSAKPIDVRLKGKDISPRYKNKTYRRIAEGTLRSERPTPGLWSVLQNPTGKGKFLVVSPLDASW